MKIKPDAYSLVQRQPMTTDATFLVYYRDIPGLSAGSHAADGTYLGDLGSAISSSSAGRSILPGPSDSLEQGARLALDGGEVVVLDFLAGTRYAYMPPTPWVAAVPGQVGGSLYWFEFQPGGSDAMPIRLMRTFDPTFGSPPDVVRSDLVAVGDVVLGEWLTQTRGHDFADDHAAVYLPWLDANSELRGWERVMMHLDGSSFSQRDSSALDTPDVGRRAGLAIGDIVTLTQRTRLGDPPEAGAYPVQQLVALNSTPETEYSLWGDEPLVVDFALDESRSMAYFLTETRQILVYALATERLLSSIQLDIRGVEAFGIHRLATPIPIATGEED